jgi:DNA-binding NarL/FixJ family response regulator
VKEKIVIADDHPLFRDGMCRMIAAILPDAEVTESGSMQEVQAALARDGAPDLFILDLLFPGMDPVDTLPALRQQCPKASIVIVSMLDDQVVIDRVMGAGADAYIAKSIPAAEIQQAILDVRAGHYVVARPGLSAQSEWQPDPIAILHFTQRQREILDMISFGRSNKEIGRKLGLSHFTVRNHVSLLLRTFNAKSRTELKAKAETLSATQTFS